MIQLYWKVGSERGNLLAALFLPGPEFVKVGKRSRLTAINVDAPRRDGLYSLRHYPPNVVVSKGPSLYVRKN